MCTTCVCENLTDRSLDEALLDASMVPKDRFMGCAGLLVVGRDEDLCAPSNRNWQISTNERRGYRTGTGNRLRAEQTSEKRHFAKIRANINLTSRRGNGYRKTSSTNLFQLHGST